MKVAQFDANWTQKLTDTTLSQGGGVPADTGNSGSGGGAGSISVTDGSTTVTPATEIDFTSGAVVTDLGGGVAGVAIGGSSGFVLSSRGGEEVYQTIAALGAAYTLDLTNGNGFDATLTADCTLTFAGATVATICSFMLLLRQDGTGGWVTTWPGSVIWANGSAPTLDTTPSTASVLTFFTLDGGTVWYGFPTGTSLVFSTTDGVTTVDPTTELTFVGATLTDLGGGNAQVAFTGGQLDYAEFTSPVTISATTEAGATTIVSGGAVTYDGSAAVVIEAFVPNVVTPAAGLGVNLFLFDGTTLGNLTYIYSAAGVLWTAAYVRRRLTPGAGSHTYSLRGSRDAGSGTASAYAGAGGAGNILPGFIRITKA